MLKYCYFVVVIIFVMAAGSPPLETDELWFVMYVVAVGSLSQGVSS